MRPRFVLLGLALCACGLNIAGTGVSEVPDEDEAGSAALPDALPDVAPPDEAAATLSDGARELPRDAAADAVAPSPDPSKVRVSYAGGKNQIVYLFDVIEKTFSALPSTGCPSAEEAAVLSDGTVYLTSSDNKTLYRLTNTGCTMIRTNSSFPYALGTAPIGTYSSTEELVGYMGQGDYVRVDGATGQVNVITPGALGTLRPSGDVTALGMRGFLAAQTGTGSGALACPSGGDCVVEVDLKTGVPIKLLSQLVGLGIYGIAHGGGQLLLYANSQVFPYNVTAKALGASLAAWPSGASFSGAGAAPYPPL